MKYTYSLSHGNIPPFENAVKAENSLRPDSPDGVHTGGGWIYQDKFYKPLDAKPFPNAEGRFPTQETIALETLQYVHPFFEHNWNMDILNDRLWIIRPVCQLISPREYFTMYHQAGLLELEAAIQSMNNAGWKINDLITLAYNPVTGNIFVLDLSSAQRITWKPDLFDSEQDMVMKFCEYAGATNLVNLRQKSHHVITSVEFTLKHPKHKWVYASFSRSVSRTWATLPENAQLIHQDHSDTSEGIPWTWIINDEPLSDKTIYSYELELGHFPWFKKE